MKWKLLKLTTGDLYLTGEEAFLRWQGYVNAGNARLVDLQDAYEIIFQEKTHCKVKKVNVFIAMQHIVSVVDFNEPVVVI